MRHIAIVAHNLRSTHNVGSLLRTAEGLGVKVYLTGYTPYPTSTHDKRLPHESLKVTKQMAKTALGAEKSANWTQNNDISKVIKELKQKGYRIAALEQTDAAKALPDYRPPAKIAIIIGREVEGAEPEILELTDEVLEIPMAGQKESFNVVIAAAMAMYHIKFAIHRKNH